MTTNEQATSMLSDPAEHRAFLAELYATAADMYDRQLLSDCQYRSPAVLSDAFAGSLAALGAGTHGWWVDLGAGTGLLGKAFAARGLVRPWAAFDLAPEMLARADGALYPLRCAADVVAGIPLRTGSCAAVVAASLMEHVAKPELLVREIGRVLIAGGVLLLTFSPSAGRRTEVFEPFSRLLAHAERDIRSHLEAAEISVVERLEFDGYRSGRDGWVRQVALLGVAGSGKGAAARSCEMSVPNDWADVVQCPRCQCHEWSSIAVPPASGTLCCRACHNRFASRDGFLDFR